MKAIVLLLAALPLWGQSETPRHLLAISSDTTVVGETQVQPLGPSDVNIEMAKGEDLLLADLTPDPSPVTGDITALRIVGPTTTVADALSACNSVAGIACNGTAVEVDVSGLAAAGTYALGIGAVNDVSTAKVVLTVTSSGYDASGVLGTTTRTVYGTHQLRQVYQSGVCDTTHICPNDATVAGGTITLRIALTDAIYSGDTLTATIASGIYTQGGTPTNSTTGTSVTNNSTLTYAQARVIANWSWPGWSRITSTSLAVEAVGYQRHAKNGKPLAAMKFLACDGTVSVGGACSSHQATVTVTDMTYDGASPDAGGKVQRYAGTLDLTGFTQGALVRVDFIAYPWVGDSTSTMDTTDGVNTQPTPLYAPQFYVYDAAGTYGSPVSVVDASINIPGVVTSGTFVSGEVVTQSTSTATAHLISVPGGSGPLPIGAIETGTVAGTNGLTWTGGTSGAVFTQTVYTVTSNTNTTVSVGLDSNSCAGVVGTNPATLSPCATIRGAAIKTRAVNVANNAAAHSDVNGTMHLKAGYFIDGGSSSAVTASSGTTADSDWLTVTPYPGVPASSVSIVGTTTSNARPGTSTTKTKYSGVTFIFISGTPSISAGSYMWVHSSNLIMTVGTAFATGTSGGVIYYTQNTVGSGGVKAMVATSTSVFPALIRGNDLSNMTSTVHVYTMLGNLKAPTTTITTGGWQTNDTIAPASNATIVAYNKSTNFAATTNVLGMYTSATTAPIGSAVVNNVFEANSTSQSTAYASGNPNLAIDNQIYWHNTTGGGRMFWSYNDGTTSAGVAGCLSRDLWSERGQLYESRFIKTDVFATQNAARVCNWPNVYGVGASGVIDANSAISAGNPVGFAAGMSPEWAGIGSKTPTIRVSQDVQATTQPPTNTAYNTINWIGFVNRAGFDGVNTGAGNGDYHLVAGSPACGMVPAGYASLPFDIAGNPRRNDGTGAAGAYECPTTGTVRRWDIQ